MSDKINIYQEYSILKQELKDVKASELKLRNSIIKSEHQTKLEGTQNFMHPRLGVKAVIVYGLNRKIDEAVLDTIWTDLSQAEKDVINYKPSVNVKKYKELEDAFPDSELFSAITEVASQASLDIKEI